METVNQLIFIASVLFLASLLVSAAASWLRAPLLLAFLALGMLAGEDGPGGIHFNNVPLSYVIGTLALAVILFDGGLNTRAETFRVALRPAAVLATLGVIITTIITGFFAAWILDLTLSQGLLLGAIIGSTDAAAVFALLRSQGVEIKTRVAATLEIESGSNDPMAAVLTIALIGVLSTAGAGVWDWHLLWFLVEHLGIGAATGVAGGYVVTWTINRLKLEEGLYPLLALAGALFIFGGTTAIGGSGFIAAYFAGVVMGNQRMRSGHAIATVADGLAWLSQIVMFIVMGLLVDPVELLKIAPAAFAVAAALTFVARPAAVYLCLAGFRMPWAEKAFVSWVGLRGAVPIVLAMFPLMAGLDHAVLYFNVAFFVVLVSLILQGWTITPLARRLGLVIPPAPGPLQRLDLDAPHRAGFQLVVYRISGDSPAAEMAPDDLSLGDDVHITAVARGERLLPPREVSTIQPDDRIYLIGPGTAIERLNKLFAAAPQAQQLTRRQFFGDFTVSGDAQLAEVATLYGAPLPEDPGTASVAEYFVRTFNGLPVVGDRLTLGSIDLVVREMEGDRITQVGLVFHPHAGGGPDAIKV